MESLLLIVRKDVCFEKKIYQFSQPDRKKYLKLLNKDKNRSKSESPEPKVLLFRLRGTH